MISVLKVLKDHLPPPLAQLVRQYSGVPKWVRRKTYRPEYNANLRNWMKGKRYSYVWVRII